MSCDCSFVSNPFELSTFSTYGFSDATSTDTSVLDGLLGYA